MFTVLKTFRIVVLVAEVGKSITAWWKIREGSEVGRPLGGGGFALGGGIGDEIPPNSGYSKLEK